jgi:hypothetical protein
VTQDQILNLMSVFWCHVVFHLIHCLLSFLLSYNRLNREHKHMMTFTPHSCTVSTTVRAGRRSVLGSIPRRVKRLFCPPKFRKGIWGPYNLRFHLKEMKSSRSAKVKTRWSYTSNTPRLFIERCLNG